LIWQCLHLEQSLQTLQFFLPVQRVSALFAVDDLSPLKEQL
jgi:hypothetical protein